MSRIQRLLEKNKNLDCTPAELEELIGYLTAEHREDEIKMIIENQLNRPVLDTVQVEDETESVLSRINLKLDSSTKRPIRLHWWLSAAAVLVVGIFIVLKLYSDKGKVYKEDIVKIHNPIITPGGNKATLKLANGKTISLTNVANGNIDNYGGVSVNKTGDGELSYSGVNKTADLDNSVNELSIPNGGTYKISLADGTMVWLNSGSTLSFPSSFKGTDREVRLSGEGYFEVAHNGKPFKVVTANQTVHVLGTHFDIQAYPGDQIVKTTLLEGSVRVNRGAEKILLTPGQMAINKDRSSLYAAPANIEEVMDWKNGLFIIDDVSISEVMKKASRWYDVEVVYQGDIGQKRLLGTVSRYKTINELLDVVSLAGNISYKIEGRRVTLMK